MNRVDPGLGREFSGGFPIRGGIRGILFVPCFPPCTLFVRVDLKGDLRVFDGLRRVKEGFLITPFFQYILHSYNILISQAKKPKPN